jgi:nucleoside-diphosphate kinase
MEQTLLLIKPDAIQRGLIGEIITRIERKGLIFSAIKMIQLDDKMLFEHYSHINTKPFFPKIVDFMKTTPVIACCVEGLDAVETVRNISGITKSRDAQPGTIRGDLGMSIQTNLIHTSDSKEAAKEEIQRFFTSEDIHSYNQVLLPFIYSEDERES